jgi:PAS domain S-box-containing protein
LTEQKTANAASNVDALQKMLDCTDEPFWLWNVKEKTIYYSAPLMQLLGYEAKSCLADQSLWRKHVTPAVFDAVDQQLRLHITGKSEKAKYLCEVNTKQNTRLWVDMTGKVTEFNGKEAITVFGLLRNVTELKSLITGLKKQNDFLNMAEEIGHTGHWRVDLVNDTLYWSPGVYKIHGVDPQYFEPTLENAINFYIPTERERVTQCVNNAIKNAQGYYLKSTIKQKLGDTVRVESIGHVEVNHQGDVTSVFGVIRDITTDAEYTEKLKLMSLVHHTINVPVFFIDEKDNVVYQDLIPQKQAKSSVLFNYINFSITDYLDFKSRAKAQGQIVRKDISFDNFISVFNLSVTFEPDEKIYIWIVENVTDKFKQEQQQLVSNRLALLGNTFGNVSHDINNVLGVALGSVEMLEMKLAKGEKNINKYVERVKNAIDKGKAVTERLLSFTRKPTADITVFDVVQELQENQYLFKQLLLNSIALTINYHVPSYFIRFPKGEFINIILNIVLNAQDAIQEKGLSGQIIIDVLVNDRNKCEIHIKDSGTGIKEENITRIFDPFYSSKSINKGNGIGLANVYNTMYKFNGDVRVEGYGELGGAHFILEFAYSPEQVENTKIAIKSSGLMGKNVLVLDDEVSIGEFVSMYLEEAKAKPICLNSKAELLTLLAEKPPLDILITDMILPDLSGQEAVDLVKNVYPNIIVYSISGFISVDESNWPYPVLRKPFNSKELASFLNN